MSNDQDEIKNIVAQLKSLQIQESELLQRLERLIEADSQVNKSPNPTREFRIGDWVQINNPKPFQFKKGTIIRIGTETDRITVQSKNGSKIVRASFNLSHLD
jgi:transcription antitermination factor NusG